MLSVLISAIIILIVAGVLFWAVTQLLPLIPLPEPFARIIYVLLVVVLVLVLVLYVLVPLLSSLTHVPLLR